MSNLVVLGLDNREDAERVMDLAGDLAGKLADVGIDDDTIKQIGQQLQQGKAAVFVLARSATTDRVIEAIKPFNPTVIQTSLSHDREEELVRALRS